MKALLLAFGAAASAFATPLMLNTSVQGRVGWDSNPVAVGGSSARILGSDETIFSAAGVGLGLSFSSLKVAYAGEVVRFADRASEDFSTHRVTLAFQATSGSWKFFADGSSLYVHGSRDSLPSVATVNANGIALWRERRAQWQHRLKIGSQYTSGTLLLRDAFTLLAYDYGTRSVAGYFPFADRSDIMAAIDAGWKQSASSQWIVGGRVGRQYQAQVPLPNCAFDYSNEYSRFAFGWEGKPTASSTISFLAGPDFRHYTGVVDTRTFVGGRDRTSFWFEANLTAKPTARLSFSGKAVRMDWLSSTGKSAYIDTCAEASASYAASKRTAIRISTKVHRCDYFPTIRDDYEFFVGTGLTFTLSPTVSVTVDGLRHRGWNNIATVPEREFSRTVLTIGVNAQF